MAKRGGPFTPVPSWKLEASSHNNKGANFNPHPHPSSASAPTLSARKLGANLWEMQDLLPLSQMGGKGLKIRHKLLDSRPNHSPRSPSDRLRSAGSLRKHSTTSLIQHHKPIDRNGRALQPESPASYSSSMEVAAYNQVVTPTSSLGIKGSLGESGYSLKTSTELLKVLNRIWSLEEQHASNVSLVKALKLELEHARSRIQELVQEQQADRHEIDDLMKQVTDDRLIRKSKEQEKIKLAIQSIRDELEDERRLRRRSENLHRKLATELSKMNSAYSKAIKSLERERKSHALLEDLCDEFAKGITDYEQEVRELKQKFGICCDHKCDRLVLHISEAWLDERLQMKHVEARGDLSERDVIIERLRCEIECFLHDKRSNGFNNDMMSQKDATRDEFLRRQSLESLHLNGSISAPQDAGDEDSIASDLHCFELNVVANDNGRHGHFRPAGDISVEVEEVGKINSTKKKNRSTERIKGRNSSSLQVQFEDKMDRSRCGGNSLQPIDGILSVHAHSNAETGGVTSSQFGIVTTQKLDCSEAQEGRQDLEFKQDMIDSPHRCKSELLDCWKGHPQISNGEESCGRFPLKGHSSTVDKDNASGDSHSLSSSVQPLKFRHTYPETCERSIKFPRGVKENTLKAKLLEARLEGQNARLKPSKNSSGGG